MSKANIIHHEFAPPQVLRDRIKCFWYTRREVDGQAFEVVPDGYAEIVFCFGGPCSVAGEALPSPFLMGLLNQPVMLNTQGWLEVLGIRCYPWTVFDLLGLPPGKSGVQVFEHPVAQLQAALAALVTAGRVAEAVALLEQYFLRQRTAVDSTLFKAGAALLAASGAIPVSDVAAAAHATVRTLERKFKQSSGHTVKDVAGLMRFEQARNRLWNDPEVSLAGLALALGYTDQSHLSREFKRYSGMTPSAFARKRRS